MKKVVIALVAILVILLALPLITGMTTKSRLEQRVAELNDNPFTVVELTSYERGWLSSTVRIGLGINPAYVAQMSGGVPPGAEFFAQRVPFLVEIKHGPIIFGDGVQIALSTVVATLDPESSVTTLARDMLGMPYVFELRGRAPITGGFEFEADIPPVDYGDGTNDLGFSGLRADGTLRDNHISVHSNMDSFDYTSVFATAVVEQIRFDMESEYMESGLGVGKGEFTLERVVVTSPMAGTEPVFTAEGLRVSVESAIDDNGRMRVGVNYNANSVAAGTSFSLTGAELGIAAANLDAEAMKAYYETIELVMGQQPAASPDEVIAALVPVFERLLEGGPSLAFDPIRFAMNGEPFSAKVLVEVDPAALPNGPRNFQDPALWLAVATVSLEAQVSKALAQDLAQQVMRMQLAGSGDPALTEDDITAMAEAQAGFVLVTLTGQGMIQDAGDTYATNARLASGSLTINGTPVPLP